MGTRTVVRFILNFGFFGWNLLVWRCFGFFGWNLLFWCCFSFFGWNLLVWFRFCFNLFASVLFVFVFILFRKLYLLVVRGDDLDFCILSAELQGFFMGFHKNIYMPVVFWIHSVLHDVFMAFINDDASHRHKISRTGVSFFGSGAAGGSPGPGFVRSIGRHGHRCPENSGQGYPAIQ